MTRKVPPSSNGPEDSDDQRTVRWAPSQDASLVDVMQQHATDSSGAAATASVESPTEPKEAETLRGSGDTIRTTPQPTSPVWPRLKVEVQEYRAWEEQAWCGLDEHLLARFLAGQCSAEERQQVEAAAQKSESVRDCLELVTEVMAGNP